MSDKNFQTFFDCGFSKVRAGTFNRNNNKESFFADSEFFTDRSNLELEIQKIITSLEKDSNEYIDNVSLMIDSPKMLSVGISLSKKLDGLKLKKSNIQFLVQEAKQQILKYYINHNIAHIIINNYKIDGVDYSYLPNEIKCNFVSLDILFICLPTDLVLYFKNIFSKSNIFIDQIISFPTGVYAADAYFWSGEIYLAQKMPDDAREKYLVILDKYSDHGRVPDSLYKLGEISMFNGEISKALGYFKKLIQEYPEVAITQIAKETLNNLQEESNLID